MESFFRLHALVVMPDHVHMILSPLSDDNGPISIPEITQAIKSTSAHRINKHLGRKGKVWQDESFDRALRREEHIPEKVQYLLENPLRAGLVGNPTHYRWFWREDAVEQLLTT
jgi:REP element-mobilizing transposase RayT